jgi:hypothetical protein
VSEGALPLCGVEMVIFSIMLNLSVQAFLLMDQREAVLDAS